MIRVSYSKELPTAKDVVQIVLKKQKETYIEHTKTGQKVVVFRLEDSKEMTRRKFILLARKLVMTAKSYNLSNIAMSFDELVFPSMKLTNEEVASLLITNMEMANFEFNKYKQEPKEGWTYVQKLVLVGDSVTAAVKKAVKEAQIIGKWTNVARRLSNTPAGDMTPENLAKEAKKFAKEASVQITVWDEKKIMSEKMGAVMGVAQGSANKPRFIILNYKGSSAKEQPIVLVGKGVTFDTGGVNIKPGKSMLDMHMDMSGAAAVISSIMMASELGVKKNIVGLVPAVENMPSGTSFRTNDILTSLSGKTIEVLHTDAEGRLILADGLTYAQKFNPRVVIDVATLTGAALVALGKRASAIFTKDEELQSNLISWGEQSGDYVWPLPLWDEYEPEIKGTFADVANMGKNPYGGSIIGAMFLYQFAKDLKCPWVHIDIAPRMVATDDEFLAKGAAGAPVRLLKEVFAQY